MADYVSTASANEVAIVDDNGHTFVLNASLHTFTIDGLQSYPLTAAQEAKLVPVLAHIVDADRLSTEICQTGPGGAGINAQLTIVDRTSTSVAKRKDLRVRRAGGPHRSSEHPALGLQISGASTGALSVSDYSCQDIGNAIYTTTQRFRTARNIALNLFRQWASDFFEISPLTGGPRFKVPNAPQWGIDLSTAAAGLLQVQTELNIMATLYRANGCWTGAWSGVVGGGFGGGSFYLACHTEDGWEISVDGGSSWAPINAPVTVCEYVAA